MVDPSGLPRIYSLVVSWILMVEVGIPWDGTM